MVNAGSAGCTTCPMVILRFSTVPLLRADDGVVGAELAGAFQLPDLGFGHAQSA